MPRGQTPSVSAGAEERGQTRQKTLEAFRHLNAPRYTVLGNSRAPAVSRRDADVADNWNGDNKLDGRVPRSKIIDRRDPSPELTERTDALVKRPSIGSFLKESTP